MPRLRTATALLLLIACGDDDDARGGAPDGSVDASRPLDAGASDPCPGSIVTALDGGPFSYALAREEAAKICADRDASLAFTNRLLDVVEGSCSDGKTYLASFGYYTERRYYFRDGGFVGYQFGAIADDAGTCAGNGAQPAEVDCPGRTKTRTWCGPEDRE